MPVSAVCPPSLVYSMFRKCLQSKKRGMWILKSSGSTVSKMDNWFCQLPVNILLAKVSECSPALCAVFLNLFCFLSLTGGFWNPVSCHQINQMGITSEKGAPVHHSSCRISVLWIHTVAFCSLMPCIYSFYFHHWNDFKQCFVYCINNRKVYKYFLPSWTNKKTNCTSLLQTFLLRNSMVLQTVPRGTP